MPRICYYVCRDVPAGSHTSYKPGRTLVSHADRREDADRMAEVYNTNRAITTFAYVVVPFPEDENFPCDHYGPGGVVA